MANFCQYISNSPLYEMLKVVYNRQEKEVTP